MHHPTNCTKFSTDIKMDSTSGSSEMSLRKFYVSNFNFWKERMSDYLIVKGQIDPPETENALEGYK